MVSLDGTRGILNDWDLSHVRTDTGSGHVGGERTGTLPFMALDLLTEKYWEGKIPRLYRHDLEGLIWVLPWVFLQFEGKKRTNLCLKAWQTGDYRECRRVKLEFLVDYDEPETSPVESWQAEWELASSLLGWIWNRRHDRTGRSRTLSSRKQMVPELNDDVIWRSFLADLTECVNANESLRSLQAYIPRP